LGAQGHSERSREQIIDGPQNSPERKGDRDYQDSEGIGAYWAIMGHEELGKGNEADFEFRKKFARRNETTP
jgi:hypothetical protein